MCSHECLFVHSVRNLLARSAERRMISKVRERVISMGRAEGASEPKLVYHQVKSANVRLQADASDPVLTV